MVHGFILMIVAVNSLLSTNIFAQKLSSFLMIMMMDINDDLFSECI